MRPLRERRSKRKHCVYRPEGRGFGQGIILSSGNAADVSGPEHCRLHIVHVSDRAGDAWGAGDPNLDQLSGFPTYDATVLEFDFVPTANQVVFNYAFASDEYPEWVNTPFNDVFAFYVNGTNHATVRQVAGDPNSQFVPVAVNNINNGNPDFYPDFVPARPDLFRPNYFNPNGPSAIDLGAGWITTVLTFQAPVNPGVVNHMKLAIADASDGIYDSAVFIQAGSLVSNKNPVADLSLIAGIWPGSPDGYGDRRRRGPGWRGAITYTIDWGDGSVPTDSQPLNETATDQSHLCVSRRIYRDADRVEWHAQRHEHGGCERAGNGQQVLNTFIVSKPSDPSNDSTPSFTFSATQAGSTFEYSLDSGVTFTACPSNLTIASPLTDGTYTIEVRAAE